MLYKGVLITQASGRIDDAVASHNRGGPYFRALGNPNPNPSTPEQDTIRACMADVVARWKTLTHDQRSAWALYSLNSPRISRIGVSRPAGGLPEYTRANICRRQADLVLETALGFVDDPPSEPAEPMPASGITVSLVTDSTHFTVNIRVAAPYALEDGGALLVYASPSLPQTINYYRSPMTLAGGFLGPDPAPTDTFSGEGVTASGERRSLRFRILRRDGRVSDHWYVMAEAP